MRRSLLALLLASLVLVVPVSSASACMNDRETRKAEQEFKTTYEKEFKSTFEKAAPEYQPEAVEPGKDRLMTWMGGIGSVLLLGAFVLTIRKARSV
jgi:hypothetical protein